MSVKRLNVLVSTAARWGGKEAAVDVVRKLLFNVLVVAQDVDDRFGLTTLVERLPGKECIHASGALVHIEVKGAFISSDSIEEIFPAGGATHVQGQPHSSRLRVHRQAEPLVLHRVQSARGQITTTECPRSEKKAPLLCARMHIEKVSRPAGESLRRRGGPAQAVEFALRQPKTGLPAYSE